MNSKKLGTTLGLTSLLSFALLSAGCPSVMIQDKVGCSPAGIVAAGMICAHTNYESTFDLDFDQGINFLEPQADSKGNLIKGPAVCFSSIDTQKIVTELKTACRLLKSKCSYETKKAIASTEAQQKALNRLTILRFRKHQNQINRTAISSK